MSSSPTFSSAEPYINLLAAAQFAHDQAQYKESVILAQTAVELFTEKTLGDLYIVRNIAYLKPEFEHLLINYNIGNAKVSGLYIALSNDPIKQAPFWADFIAHTELRNALVHEGQDASQDQSSASLQAVTALIDHIVESNTVR